MGKGRPKGGKGRKNNSFVEGGDFDIRVEGYKK